MIPDERMRQAVRGRWAVAAVFLVNGFLIGSWAPQIPVTRDRLEISEFTLGLLILGFGVGALVAMPVCGYLIGRIGSRSTVRLFGIASTVGLLLLALAPGLWSAALALVVFGALVGGTDVAMNANAVEVEKRQARAIMSSCHGFWSLGGVAGAALGGILIELYDVQFASKTNLDGATEWGFCPRQEAPEGGRREVEYTWIYVYGRMPTCGCVINYSIASRSTPTDGMKK